MKPSLRIRLLEACLLLALAGGMIAVRSCKTDSRTFVETDADTTLLPSPPEAYWNAYSNLVWTKYRWMRVRRDPPRDADLLSFATSTTNICEQELALHAIVVTDRSQSIPLLKQLAENSSIPGDVRRRGIYCVILDYIHPSSVSDWNSKTAGVFLDFCRWAVDHDHDAVCQAGAYRVLLECDPEWRTSDHRRAVLLRWLANAESDFQRKGLQRQLDTMYDPPPPPPEPGKYLEIEIIE